MFASFDFINNQIAMNKQRFSFLIFLIGMVFLLSSFTKSTNDETFVIDTKRSSVQWLAKKVGGEHRGGINLASGQLIIRENSIKDGSFTVDMASMSCTDLEGEWNKKLIDHLKSDDFFAVGKNPVAKFNIKKITTISANRIQVNGDLTIKGITHPLTFPAKIIKQNNELTAIADHIKVDRTKYDIRYGSKSFFASLGDKAIDNVFELNIHLIASK